MSETTNDSNGLGRKALGILIEKIEEMAIRAEAARHDAQARANEHAGKLESRFDTFREEAQYLAYGQGLRREELLKSLGSCLRLLASLDGSAQPTESVLPGRVVSLVSGEDEVRRYLIAPAGAGVKIRVGSFEILVVSPAAPIGRALLHREVGDEVALNGNGRDGSEWVVDEIL